MLNSISIRALAGLLILAAAPAMASIPSDKPSDVELRIGGAELILPNTYAVNQNDVISLAVTARPGDLIWAFALPLDANLEWSGEIEFTLLFDPAVATGKLSTDLMVPEGASGAFLVAADRDRGRRRAPAQREQDREGPASDDQTRRGSRHRRSRHARRIAFVILRNRRPPTWRSPAFFLRGWLPAVVWLGRWAAV